MSAPTPGPWVVAHRKGQTAIRGAATECVAVIPSPLGEGYGVTRGVERSANARLIAASPDLAESVRLLLKLHEAHHNEPVHVAARAALSKAQVQS